MIKIRPNTKIEIQIIFDSSDSKDKLVDELKKVQEQLVNVREMKLQLERRNIALSGAIQQCDIFLEFFDVSPTSSIPSQDDSAVLNAALS
mgnify:CR=1 FL=1